MAGAGYKLFNTGDVLTAAQVNTYLMEQTVMVFANAAARTTALSGVVSEGMISYLKDTNAVEVYDGSNWVSSDDPNAIQNTIVDAKGDLIAASAADTPARLAVGSDGSTLVADSSATTGLRYNPQNALVNPVINGGMDIWQRGTSLTPSAGVVTYTTDRWQTYRGVSGYTVSRQTTSDTTNLANIQYSARLQRTAGNTATDTIYFTQSIETANTIPYAGKTLTLTFYARAGANYSAASSQFFTVVYSGTGTDQNVNNGYTGSAQLVLQSNTLTTTWQRFAHTFTLGATATEFAPYFYWTPTGTAGANDWVEITGVQFDIGTYTASSAPTFRRAGGNIAGELAACQRYYYRTSGNGGYRRFGAGQCYGTGNVVAYISFPVTMRTNPTALEQSGTASHYAVTNSTAGPVACNTVPSFDNANNNGSTVLFTTASGLTAGNATTVMDNNTSSAYLGWSAEL